MRLFLRGLLFDFEFIGGMFDKIPQWRVDMKMAGRWVTNFGMRSLGKIEFIEVYRYQRFWRT